jgi:hypothetical protein
MAFMTINGVVYPVLRDGMTQGPSIPIGRKRRTWDGQKKSGVTKKKRTWTVPLAPILDTAFATLETAVATGAFATLNGDMTGNVAVAVDVEIANVGYFRERPTDQMRRTPMLEVEEV